MKDAGYCYFLEAVGLNRFKIGHAKILPNRFDQLDTASPCDLRIYGVIKGKDYIRTEVEFHNALKDRRIRRDNGKGNWKEWFKLTRAEVEKLVHTSDGFTVADGDFVVEAPSDSNLSKIDINVTKEIVKTITSPSAKINTSMTNASVFNKVMFCIFTLFCAFTLIFCGNNYIEWNHKKKEMGFVFDKAYDDYFRLDSLCNVADADTNSNAINRFRSMNSSNSAFLYLLTVCDEYSLTSPDKTDLDVKYLTYCRLKKSIDILSSFLQVCEAYKSTVSDSHIGEISGVIKLKTADLLIMQKSVKQLEGSDTWLWFKYNNMVYNNSDLNYGFLEKLEIFDSN